MTSEFDDVLMAVLNSAANARVESYEGFLENLPTVEAGIPSASTGPLVMDSLEDRLRRQYLEAAEGPDIEHDYERDRQARIARALRQSGQEDASTLPDGLHTGSCAPVGSGLGLLPVSLHIDNYVDDAPPIPSFLPSAAASPAPSALAAAAAAGARRGNSLDAQPLGSPPQYSLNKDGGARRTSGGAGGATEGDGDASGAGRTPPPLPGEVCPLEEDYFALPPMALGFKPDASSAPEACVSLDEEGRSDEPGPASGAGAAAAPSAAAQGATVPPERTQSVPSDAGRVPGAVVGAAKNALPPSAARGRGASSREAGDSATEIEAFALDPSFDYDTVKLTRREWPARPGLGPLGAAAAVGSVTAEAEAGAAAEGTRT